MVYKVFSFFLFFTLISCSSFNFPFKDNRDVEDENTEVKVIATQGQNINLRSFLKKEYKNSELKLSSDIPAVFNISDINDKNTITLSSAFGTDFDFSQVGEYNITFIANVSENQRVNISYKIIIAPFEGEGTAESPYLIRNQSQFFYINQSSQKYFRLETVLNFNGNHWFESQALDGYFDGNARNGFRIENIRVGTFCVIGIFSKISNSTIYDLEGSNLHFENDCRGSSIGAIAASSFQSHIIHTRLINVRVTNTFGPSKTTGGFVGEMIDSHIRNSSYINGFIRGDGVDTGGFAGTLNKSTITNVYIENTQMKGERIGGIIGRNIKSPSHISDVSITTDGIIDGTTIFPIGMDFPTNSYYNANTTGIMGGPIKDGIGLTTISYLQQTSFSQLDFQNTWIMGGLGPVLRRTTVGPPR